MEKMEILFRCNNLSPTSADIIIRPGTILVHIREVRLSDDVVSYAILNHDVDVIIIYRIFTLGHSFEGEAPLRGCRQTLISFMYKLVSKLLCFFGGMRTTRKHVDFDYSSFLGPNYKQTTM